MGLDTDRPSLRRRRASRLYRTKGTAGRDGHEMRLAGHDEPFVLANDGFFGRQGRIACRCAPPVVQLLAGAAGGSRRVGGDGAGVVIRHFARRHAGQLLVTREGGQALQQKKGRAKECPERVARRARRRRPPACRPAPAAPAPRGFHLQSRAFSSAMRRSTSSSTSAARTSSARHRRSSMRTLGLLRPSSISER